MVSGRIGPGYRISVEVTLLGSNGQQLSVETILDTGFEGYLALTPDIIQSLGLEYPQENTYTLADGQKVQFNTYIATVVWHDRPRLAIVLESEMPLMGTFLLWGNRVSFEMLAGGSVTIEELSF